MHLSVIHTYPLSLTLQDGAIGKRTLLFVSILFYMLLTGMPASVVRASLMFSSLAAQALMRVRPVTSLLFPRFDASCFSGGSCRYRFSAFVYHNVGITNLGAAFSEKIKALETKRQNRLRTIVLTELLSGLVNKAVLSRRYSFAACCLDIFRQDFTCFVIQI